MKRLQVRTQRTPERPWSDASWGLSNSCACSCWVKNYQKCVQPRASAHSWFVSGLKTVTWVSRNLTSHTKPIIFCGVSFWGDQRHAHLPQPCKITSLWLVSSDVENLNNLTLFYALLLQMLGVLNTPNVLSSVLGTGQEQLNSLPTQSLDWRLSTPSNSHVSNGDMNYR